MTPDRQLDEIERLNTRLKEKILSHLPQAGKYEAPNAVLRLARHDEVGQPEHCFDKPLVSIIIQGEKHTIMGSANLRYAKNQCLVVGVDMPNTFQVVGASPEHPFLGVAIYLDKQLISQLMTEIELPPEPENDSSPGVSVVDAGTELLDAFLRLVEVLDNPGRISVLAPMLIREIHYLLLTGPQGEQLRRINTYGTQSHQVAKAVVWMRDNYKESVHVDTLAQRVHMATSTFHRHFKEVTTLSPLQYLKRLRLHEARRLMLVEGQDASSAGLFVGYESSAQFNREYKRLFGEPPLRDIKRLR